MPDSINNPTVALYVAAAVALVVMIGFFVYLWSLDRRVRELRRQLAQLHTEDELRDAQTSDDRSAPLRPQRIEQELNDDLDRP